MLRRRVVGRGGKAIACGCVVDGDGVICGWIMGILVGLV